jgi:hypothetical protein
VPRSIVLTRWTREGAQAALIRTKASLPLLRGPVVLRLGPDDPGRRETELARDEDVSQDLATVLVRGTKRSTRYRTVTVVSDAARSLLEYALRYAAGTGGLLFLPWASARRDLLAARKQAGIPRCSPNDLRRTCATWLGAAGVPPDLLAPVMGHADTRMVERVYGRLPVQTLASRIAAAIGPEHCSTFVTASDRQTVAHLSHHATPDSPFLLVPALPRTTPRS